VRNIRSRQVVENGELVKTTTRGRKKASGLVSTDSVIVQRQKTADAAPPRRRGRPRKNPVDDSRASPCPSRDPVAEEVITVAGNGTCSPEGTVRGQEKPQCPAQVDVPSHTHISAQTVGSPGRSAPAISPTIP
ncbi:hypothetical protein FHETE_11337, partial [Fusarium heterosporum]